MVLEEIRTSWEGGMMDIFIDAQLICGIPNLEDMFMIQVYSMSVVYISNVSEAFHSS